MRNTFAKTINQLALEDKNIILLSGDIGNKMFDQLKKNCPKQFINCGIAEENMISVAAGMALCNLRPIIYTITPFTTIRCLEQIKIGVSYHNAPVVIVGTGSGLSYSELGPTHHSLDDIAILKTIPDINILAPSDGLELSEFLKEALKCDKPTYIRIGKKGEPNLNLLSNKINIGKANLLKNGKDFIILGIGPILSEALKASKLLNNYGFDIAIASMGSIRPLDFKFLEKLNKVNFSNWITLEEHYTNGGLGTTIMEWIFEKKLSQEIKLTKLGVPNKFINELGNQTYLRKKFRIDAEGIKNMILRI